MKSYRQKSKTLNYGEISERLIFCLKKVTKASDEDITEGVWELLLAGRFTCSNPNYVRS